jgi:small ligand-binding sensory domain FIST
MQAVQNQFSVAAHWNGDFDERALEAWTEQLRESLQAPSVSLGLVFMHPRLFSHAAEILEILQVHAKIPLLVGCSSISLIAGAQEMEDNAGLVVGLYHLPGAQLHSFRFTPEQTEEATGPGYWHMESGLSPEKVNGWLVFADPFHMDAETWLQNWNEAYAPLPIVGGLATGEGAEPRTQLYHNGNVFENGGIAIGIAGDVTLGSVISQGCTPIGDTWTITKAERNLIHEIGNRPAYQILAETFNSLPAEEQKNARGNLFIGIVINEYLEEFGRGDFLIRNLLGADPNSGVLAVGAFPRAGQTIQFQRRDAAASTEDITLLLQRAQKKLAGKTLYGGCLCSCNGRGHRLFGEPNHDAAHVQAHLGPMGLAGFFCNGEIGPVGEKSFLHGYTASLALFVKRD